METRANEDRFELLDIQIYDEPTVKKVTKKKRKIGADESRVSQKGDNKRPLIRSLIWMPH